MEAGKPGACLSLYLGLQRLLNSWSLTPTIFQFSSSLLVVFSKGFKYSIGIRRAVEKRPIIVQILF